ncbi:MAG TPA: hypothetical protein VGU20_22340 [Stellaceae bacterium]|nr:hypothetical protein [Stellaceae bacterium]
MTARHPAVILAGSLIVAAGLLLPLAFVSVPPFCDLYFHIARMVVLADPAAPYVRDWYAPDWHVVPNLAMDAIVPLLARIMPVLTAVKLFVAATFLLLLFGTLALNHALYRQLSWLPLLAGLFVYNQIVFIGYFNYLFGLALVLWAAALWFYLATSAPLLRLLAASLATILLYAAHLFAVGLFGVVLLSGELAAWRRDRRLGFHAAMAVVPFIAPLALFLTSHTVAVAGMGAIDYWPIVKLLAPFTPFLTLNPPVDLAILACTIAGTVLLVRRGGIEVAPPLRVALLLLPPLVLLAPTAMIGTFYADLRLPVAIVFIVLAACRLRGEGAREVGIIAAAALIFVLRIAALTVDFRVAGSEMDELRDAYRRMPAGAVVFTATLHHGSFFLDALTTPRQWRPLWEREDTLPLDHVTTVALTDRAVLVPQTLMVDGQQPTRMLPEFAALKALQADAAGHWYSFHDAHGLAGADELDGWIQRIGNAVNAPPYRFSAVYVALVDPDGRAALPPGAREVFAEHGYRLWDISPLMTAAGH